MVRPGAEPESRRRGGARWLHDRAHQALQERDIVVELGPDHAAAGARIVAEAKENASFTLQKALAELEEARKNRGASVGLFVFSARTAPDGLEPLTRYGSDVVVVWDAEDPRSDVVLAAGLSVAKALCTHSKGKREAEIADFEAIERAIREIENKHRTSIKSQAGREFSTTRSTI